MPVYHEYDGLKSWRGIAKCQRYHLLFPKQTPRSEFQLGKVEVYLSSERFLELIFGVIKIGSVFPNKGLEGVVADNAVDP